MARWLVLAEEDRNGPGDLVAEVVEVGTFDSRDDANAAAIAESRSRDVAWTAVADATQPSKLTGASHTLVALYADGRRA